MITKDDTSGKGVFLQFCDEVIREWWKRDRDGVSEFWQAQIAQRQTRRITNPAVDHPGCSAATRFCIMSSSEWNLPKSWNWAIQDILKHCLRHNKHRRA